MSPILGYYRARLMDEEDLILYADEPRIIVHLPLGFEEQLYEVYGYGLYPCDACDAVIEFLQTTCPDLTDDWETLEESLYV